MYKRTIAAVLTVASLAVAGCSSDTRQSIKTDVETAVTEVGAAIDNATKDAAEAAARTIATQQGEEQFVNAGHTLDGPLTCEATIADGVTSINISCTGTTKDGKPAALTGTTNELPGASVVSLNGQFSGTVDGTEVFSTQRLGG
ncbi:MAG: hypothetical protein ABIR32_23025 [Ilumatobacteraceae bacterium]